MAKETVGKTIAVALGVCIVCSIFVSSAAVYLKPIQTVNKQLAKKMNILVAAGLMQEGEDVDIESLFGRIEARLVNLETGEFAPNTDASAFDARAASRDPDQSIRLSSSQDIAGIKTRAKFGLVYLLRENGELQRIILPVYGKGLWSTMYGFVAFANDTNTIENFLFYEHGETPGLGGEVDNPRWKALWKGKKAFDENWETKISVIKGFVDPSSPNADHQVDGLSGATLTARGVGYLVQFWLGDNGYGPFLAKIRGEDSDE